MDTKGKISDQVPPLDLDFTKTPRNQNANGNSQTPNPPGNGTGQSHHGSHPHSESMSVIEHVVSPREKIIKEATEGIVSPREKIVEEAKEGIVSPRDEDVSPRSKTKLRRLFKRKSSPGKVKREGDSERSVSADCYAAVSDDEIISNLPVDEENRQTLPSPTHGSKVTFSFN